MTLLSWFLSQFLSLCFIGTFVVACGGETGTVTLQLQCVGMAPETSPRTALSYQPEAAVSSANYTAKWGQSGAADSFKVFVKKIVIDDYDVATESAGEPVTIVESSDSGGAGLDLISGKWI